MKSQKWKGNACKMAVAALSAVLLPLVLPSWGAPDDAPISNEMLRLGERIYREGILSSGEPLQASVSGERGAPGMTFACASCHLRSGLGSLDEMSYAPPVNGDNLFKPLMLRYKGFDRNPRYAPLTMLRPAYTDGSLLEAIRNGINPGGRVLNSAMPRYSLGEKDAMLLIAYLKGLSSSFSPGVTNTTLRFATVIAEDVPPEERDAMLASLEYYVNLKNNQVKAYNSPQGAKSRQMVENMLVSKELATKSISLSRWVLKGAPDGWGEQLEAYSRKEPVFALLGGIVKGDWSPIHRFSEENRIPTLFPNTELPVISNSDWYTLYLSKGYYQEGEAAARYLNARSYGTSGKRIIQAVRQSPEAKALASGFNQAWQELGHGAPVTFPLALGGGLNKESLEMLLESGKPAVLIVWDDAGAIPALTDLAEPGKRPEMIFVSGRYLGNSIWTLPERMRDIIYITYPFSFSPAVIKGGMGSLKTQGDQADTLRQSDVPLKGSAERIAALTSSMTQLLTAALIELKGNYYRDNFLDVLGMMQSQQYPLFDTISFGPDQRYASNGCYIVQLSGGKEPRLVKKSAWEIQ
jgi:hypothetical protein